MTKKVTYEGWPTTSSVHHRTFRYVNVQELLGLSSGWENNMVDEQRLYDTPTRHKKHQSVLASLVKCGMEVIQGTEEVSAPGLPKGCTIFPGATIYIKEKDEKVFVIDGQGRLYTLDVGVLMNGMHIPDSFDNAELEKYCSWCKGMTLSDPRNGMPEVRQAILDKVYFLLETDDNMDDNGYGFFSHNNGEPLKTNDKVRASHCGSWYYKKVVEIARQIRSLALSNADRTAYRFKGLPANAKHNKDWLVSPLTRSGMKYRGSKNDGKIFDIICRCASIGQGPWVSDDKDAKDQLFTLKKDMTKKNVELELSEVMRLVFATANIIRNTEGLHNIPIFYGLYEYLYNKGRVLELPANEVAKLTDDERAKYENNLSKAKAKARAEQAKAIEELSTDKFRKAFAEAIASTEEVIVDGETVSSTRARWMESNGGKDKNKIDYVANIIIPEAIGRKDA